MSKYGIIMDNKPECSTCGFAEMNGMYLTRCSFTGKDISGYSSFDMDKDCPNDGVEDK